MPDGDFYPPKRDLSHPFDPPAAVMAWASEEPVRRVRTWDGTQAWLITKYRDIRFVLSDDRFSADPSRPGFPEKSAAYQQNLGQDRTVRTLDNPEHGRHKRMLLRDFTVKRVDDMRPVIQEKIDAQIEAMLAKGPPVDLVADLGFPIPTMVICELLGVPYADRDFFSERSQLAISGDVPAEISAGAGRELNAYSEKLIDLKDSEPGNDLISRLVTEQLRHGHLTRKEVVDYVRFILIAGHETTTNMIALSTLALLRHPAQRDILVDNPDKATVANAVEELLRYLSVTHNGRRRVAKVDVVVGGHTIRAGDGVIAANNVGDRDESVFPNAATLDLRRKNANAHIAFGAGIHQCLGQLLSRVELQLLHTNLWKRIPTLALAAPFETLEFNEGTSVFGVRKLPVTWS